MDGHVARMGTGFQFESLKLKDDIHIDIDEASHGRVNCIQLHSCI